MKIITAKEKSLEKFLMEDLADGDSLIVRKEKFAPVSTLLGKNAMYVLNNPSNKEPVRKLRKKKLAKVSIAGSPVNFSGFTSEQDS